MTTTQLRRGENSLLLWNLTDLSNPVHSFVGHTDVVLEFGWRRSRHGKILNYLNYNYLLSSLAYSFLRYYFR